MAKGKALNPADAARKAARKKELKKNKAERQKNRDFALVKQDTTELEDEVAQLEGVLEPSAQQKARLSELKSELQHIQKKKEGYVAAHPEQRNLVYRRKYDKPSDGNEGKSGTVGSATVKRNLFKKNGLPRHPERSVYYDPVMNPYGMPPPGMPYQERHLLSGEVDSEAEDREASDSDEEIEMPKGPPPGEYAQDAESDDDIPLPEGPPPGQIELPPLPPGPPPVPGGPIPSTVPLPPPSFMPPMPLQCAPGMMPVPPPFPPPIFMPPPTAPPGLFPPVQNGPRGSRTMSVTAMQDPLSGLSQQTFQGYYSSRPPSSSKPSQNHTPAPVSSLPPPPPSLPSRPKPPPSSDAIVSAGPKLRDFKKESTMFVPASLKRKKGGSSKVNAAPSAAGVTADDRDVDNRPDLMSALKERMGLMAEPPQIEATAPKRQKLEKPKDDYDKFMEEIGGMLNPVNS